MAPDLRPAGRRAPRGKAPNLAFVRKVQVQARREATSARRGGDADRPDGGSEGRLKHAQHSRALFRVHPHGSRHVPWAGTLCGVPGERAPQSGRCDENAPDLTLSGVTETGVLVRRDAAKRREQRAEEVGGGSRLVDSFTETPDVCKHPYGVRAHFLARNGRRGAERTVLLQVLLVSVLRYWRKLKNIPVDQAKRRALRRAKKDRRYLLGRGGGQW